MLKIAVGVGERIRSLEHLVHQCVVACVASRNLVHHKYLVDGDATRSSHALQVEVKGAMEHKQGAQDLVTAADIDVQNLIFTALTSRRFRPDVTALSPHDGPAFALLGEEANAFDPDSAVAEGFHVYIEAAKATPICRATQSLLLQRATPVPPTDLFAVFVDPIDATVAFVKGRKEAPMTLIGITRNGSPVAGVVTRIFSEGPTDTADCPSVSYCVLDGPCCLWGTPYEHPPPKATNVVVQSTSETDSLRVTCSSTTTSPTHAALIKSIMPAQLFPAYGAGNKLMMVAQGAAATSLGWKASTTYSDAADVDAFVSMGSLCVWDVCAPHAFLKWFGGDAVAVDPATGATTTIDYAGPSNKAVPPGLSFVAASAPSRLADITRRVSIRPSRL